MCMCDLCALADGRNFDLRRPPAIGLPGTVHLGCACEAVVPYPDAEMLV